MERQKAEVAKRVAQADIVITTALIPGRPAPVLVTEEMVKSMKPGSVIVDLAAEAGGNCPLTELNKTVVKHGVTLVGESNLPGTVAADASALYARNLLNFINLLCDPKNGGAININREDDIIAGIADRDRWRGRASREIRTELNEMNGGVDPVILNLTVFVLAIFVGYHVVWNVTPALHTPLMAVTNAVSGIIIVGAMLAAGPAETGYRHDTGTGCGDAGRGQCVRRFPGHPAHAGYVQEEKEVRENHVGQFCCTRLSRRCGPVHPDAEGSEFPGIGTARQSCSA